MVDPEAGPGVDPETRRPAEAGVAATVADAAATMADAAATVADAAATGADQVADRR